MNFFNVGINIFLDGFLPTENLRFREVALSFKVSADEQIKERLHQIPYPVLNKKLGTFQLDVDAGYFSDSEIIVMLGQNGSENLSNNFGIVKF